MKTVLLRISYIASAALAAALAAPALHASTEMKLDSAPVDVRDFGSLQRGARHFVNYCLNCHSASYMRYNRLTDIGLTEQQIKDNLLFTADKVGETMQVAMGAKESKEWFGAAPPDLTVIARSRGADWLYTYMRSFYRDPATATGWNNLAFPNVGMPHVLWELQGQQTLEVHESGEGAHKHVEKTLKLEQPGKLPPAEYDRFVGDLVNYLVYMGEPAQLERQRAGVITLLFLALSFPVVYLLKKEFWKDVH